MSEGSLLRLFNCPEFTLEMLLEYLCRNKNSGVLTFLINKLYCYPPLSFQNYIPQLLHINFYKTSCLGLETVLLRSSIDNHLFAMSLHFNLSAFIADCEYSVLHRAQEFLENLDMAIVNASVPKQISDSAPPHFFGLESSELDLDAFNRKSIRAEYFEYQLKIVNLLCKVSVALNQIPFEMRDSKLVLWLEGLNNKITQHRKKANQAGSSGKLSRGPALGLQFHEDCDSGVPQVVRVLYEKGLCFCTKARVPYKLVYESIDVKEEGINDNSSLHSVDEDDLRYVSKVDIETVNKTVHKEVRFEGFNEYVENAEKNINESHTPRRISNADAAGNIWGEDWATLSAKVKESSPFGHYSSWKLRGIIVKGLDDLRQEYLAMQLITKVKEILKNAQLSLYIRSYEIKVISNYMGFIEFIPNTLSIHSIKKNFQNYTTLENFFKDNWAESFEEAQRNFVQSMAGYSLICYLLNIKDRHNANILIDSLGHVIHIDFGFFLTISPGGNIGFESAPFKLTQEMADVMGGAGGEMFRYFKILLFQGFLEVRKYAHVLLMIIEAMGDKSNIPCLYDAKMALEGFKNRLKLNLTDEKCIAFIDEIVSESLANWRTDKYDDFQYLTNGIL